MKLTQERLEKEHGRAMEDTHDGVDSDPPEDEDDNASRSSTGTGTGTSLSRSNHVNQKDRAQEDKILGNELNRQVIGIRLLVILVLVASTITVALLVFFYVDNQENTQFEEDFLADANKVLVSLDSKLDLTMGAMDSFVVGLASYAKASNSTWPFVTLPDFGVKAKKTKSLSNAVVMSIYTGVTNETRLDWEAYTGPNNYWVNETIAVQERDSTYLGEVKYLGTTRRH